MGRQVRRVNETVAVDGSGQLTSQPDTGIGRPLRGSVDQLKHLGTASRPCG